jgi:hypothetical protein
MPSLPLLSPKGVLYTIQPEWIEHHSLPFGGQSLWRMERQGEFVGHFTTRTGAEDYLKQREAPKLE